MSEHLLLPCSLQSEGAVVGPVGSEEPAPAEFLRGENETCSESSAEPREAGFPLKQIELENITTSPPPIGSQWRFSCSGGICSNAIWTNTHESDILKLSSAYKIFVTDGENYFQCLNKISFNVELCQNMLITSYCVILSA